jgi:hypothetical protein
LMLFLVFLFSLGSRSRKRFLKNRRATWKRMQISVHGFMDSIGFVE